ncbi:MAG: hypothetical protein LBT97_12975 [Planctomycetota bacterium]|jgi:hypothetical protein|nr:hypothetical protein [Planctomycetota bacterium]
MPVGAFAAMVFSGMSLAAGFSVGMGLMFAGSAMSLVGQVTGNEKLAKIGSIAGLAGGITSLVQNFSAVTEAASSTASTAAEGASASAATAGNTVQDALASGSGVPLSDLGKSLYGSGGILAEANPALNAAAGSSLAGSTNGTALGFDLGSGLGAGAGSSLAGGGSGAALGYNLGSGLGTGASLGSAQAGASLSGLNISTPDPSISEKIRTWVGENKEMLEIGSKVLSGIGDGIASERQAKAVEEAAKIKGEMELALQQNNFDRADELMARYSQSIKDLQAPQELFKGDADIYSGTQNGENVKRGIINRVWQPNFSQKQGV